MADDPPMGLPLQPSPGPGTLTQPELDKAIAWLRAKWDQPIACPFHQGPTRWEVQDRLAQMHGYSREGALSLSEVTFPVIIVTCTTCGFMVPVNAIVAGVLPVQGSELPIQPPGDQ